MTLIKCAECKAELEETSFSQPDQSEAGAVCQRCSESFRSISERKTEDLSSGQNDEVFAEITRIRADGVRIQSIEVKECETHAKKIKDYICLAETCQGVGVLHCRLCSKTDHLNCPKEFTLRTFDLERHCFLDVRSCEEQLGRLKTVLSRKGLALSATKAMEEFMEREVSKLLQVHEFIAAGDIGGLKIELDQTNEEVSIRSKALGVSGTCLEGW